MYDIGTNTTQNNYEKQVNNQCRQGLNKTFGIFVVVKVSFDFHHKQALIVLDYVVSAFSLYLNNQTNGKQTSPFNFFVSSEYIELLILAILGQFT